MNFLEAVQKLAADNPDCDYAQCRAAMTAEVDYLMIEAKGRDKYKHCVYNAYGTICDWLKGGHKADVILTWRSLAAFMYPRRPAIVWAVCIAMAREAEAEAKAGPVYGRACVLTGADGEREDDCTTHEHEAAEC